MHERLDSRLTMSDPLRDLESALVEDPLDGSRDRGGWGRWLAGSFALVALIAISALALVGALTERSSGTDEVPSSGASVAPDNSASNGETAETSSSSLGRVDPPSRIHSAMALVPSTGEIVLFGGRLGSRSEPIADLWVLGPQGEWAAVPATLEPGPRELAELLYVESEDQVVAIGGSPKAILGCGLQTFVTNAVVDVWALDLGGPTWTRRTTNSGPSDRWGHAAAYDSVADRIVLFGGAGGDFSRGFATVLGDTWLLDPASGVWVEVESEAAPSGRACHSMAFNPEDGLVYLWGGQVSMSSGEAQLWVFDTGSLAWSVVPTNEGPEPKWLHTLTFEPSSGLIFLVGGFGPTTRETASGQTTALEGSSEVWVLDPATSRWSQSAPLPEAVAGHSTAPDGQGGLVVVAGSGTFTMASIGGGWTEVP